MQVIADGISLAGPHGTVLPETSLAVADGELAIVHGEPGPALTALGLAIAGRLRPTAGTVTVDGVRDEAALRAHSAVADVPGVTEPDASLPLGEVVAEELGFAGRPAGKEAVATWLLWYSNELDGGEPFGRLDAELRTRMLADLAVCRPGVGLLVLDRPDRHSSEADSWWMPAYEHAERGTAVVVLTATAPVPTLPSPPARIGALDQPSPQRCTAHHPRAAGTVGLPV